MVDNLGKKYELINGTGGGPSVSRQRIGGWLLFPVLQPSATSFDLGYSGYRLDNIEFISPERYALKQGNHAINNSVKSTGSVRNEFTLTLEGIDVMEGGRMRLNVSILNNTDYARGIMASQSAYLIDNAGRRYNAIYGYGSIFENTWRMPANERIRGWMFFQSLIDGQTEATLKHSDFEPITFNLQGAG